MWAPFAADLPVLDASQVLGGAAAAEVGSDGRLTGRANVRPPVAWETWGIPDALIDRGEDLLAPVDPALLTDADGCALSERDVLPVERESFPSPYDSGLLAAVSEDLVDRRRARERGRAHPITAEVIEHEGGHPWETLTCRECGHQPTVLSWCGVQLCIPDWRKQANRTRGKVLSVLIEFLRHRADIGPGFQPGSRRMNLRFATFTVKNGPVLKERVRFLLESWGRLRQQALWRDRVDGAIAILEVTWSADTGFHPHLHVVFGGRFIPHDDRQAHWVRRRRPLHAPPRRAYQLTIEGLHRPIGDQPLKLEGEWVREPNLVGAWIRATRGEASVVDVRSLDEGLPLGKSVAEIAKYLTKPYASSADGPDVPIASWPESVRLELAELIAGETRVRWECAKHHGRRSACLAASCPYGAWHQESIGLRRVRLYGEFRRILTAMEREDDAPDGDGAVCPECRTGRLLTKRECEVLMDEGWTLPPAAKWPPPSSDSGLHLIHAHSSRATPGCREARTPRRHDPAGSPGPPPDEDDLFGGRATRTDRYRHEREPGPGDWWEGSAA